MKRKSIGLVLILVLIALTTFGGTVFAGDPIDQDESELSTFTPSITDKKMSPEFYEQKTPSKPLPESDLSRIIFSKDWLLKNDAEPNPWTIEVSFPASWLVKSPFTDENSESVELVVPTNMLNTHNKNKNLEEVSVVFPVYYFSGLPSPEIPSGPDIKYIKNTGSDSGTKGIDYQQRITYVPTAGDNILGAAGTVRPYTHENPESETFLTYHEIEFYGDGSYDCIEIISEMNTNEEETEVWYVIYNNQSTVAFWGGDAHVTVDVGDSVYYEWWNTNGYYNLYLYYGGDWYGDFYYDSTASNYYHEFTGSSELDSIGGISEEFFAYTNPVCIIDLYTDDWQGASYVNQRLDYSFITDDEAYVGTTHSIGSSGLYFYLWATN